jgi:hypothetical protein
MTELFPVTYKAACDFVRENHRHNSQPQGHKFSIGLKADGKLTGVVVCGRPVARAYDDGCTAEITRCCVLDNQPNANSKLYAAALRAAKAMGYTKVITYTLPAESGASLKAVGFQFDGQTAYHPWNTALRPRKAPDKYPVGSKNRWIKNL